ncbi:MULTISPECIES: hypothetical protein [Streptomyces]|nr:MULTISPECIES: hypothetical protein [Streptomyces]
MFAPMKKPGCGGWLEAVFGTVDGTGAAVGRLSAFDVRPWWES